MTMTAAARGGQHILLEGHARLAALKALGHTEAPCLLAKDDESYTYNNRINRLSTVQEHFMVRRALERGVSAERLAQALNIDVTATVDCSRHHDLLSICHIWGMQALNTAFAPARFAGCPAVRLISLLQRVSPEH